MNTEIKVFIKHSKSDVANITCGVPQAPILGQLKLFNIYWWTGS